MDATQAYALSCIRRHCERGEHPVHPITPNNKHELAQAAAYYTLTNRLRAEVDYGLFTTTLRHTLWPFGAEGYCHGDRIQDLVKAGQLIVAEIARLWLLRHEQLLDVVPIDLHNECNWDDWQQAFVAAGRADGYSEEELAATDWPAVRKSQFSQGVLALQAYRCYFDDPAAQFFCPNNER
jgi:hypothetical protein